MSKYLPKFDSEDRDMLILDNIFESEDCLEYADRHNLNVMFTETRSDASFECALAFKKRGYDMELCEREAYAPDGLKLNPSIYVLFTRKGNVPEPEGDKMTVKEYNTVFLPKIDAASCVISCMENDFKKTKDYDGCMRELKILGWSEETKSTILTALDYYRQHEGIDKLEIKQD